MGKGLLREDIHAWPLLLQNRWYMGTYRFSVQVEFCCMLCADNGRTQNANNNQRVTISAAYPRTQTLLKKKRMVKTFRALCHRDFRLLWGRLAVSTVGTWMQVVAQTLLVLKITHGSAFALGSVSLAQALAFFFFALVGGTYADRVDKRHLLMFTQASSARTGYLVGFSHTINQPSPDRIGLRDEYVLSGIGNQRLVPDINQEKQFFYQGSRQMTNLSRRYYEREPGARSALPFQETIRGLHRGLEFVANS